MDYQKFESWGAVVEAARAGVRLAYKAPMDYYAVTIRVVKVHASGTIRVDPMRGGCSRFTADAGHLDRFRRMA